MTSPAREPLTEMINERTRSLDLLPVIEQARLMNEEDRRVPEAVAATLPQISAAVARIANALRRGGRLVYAGAGTSGRLAVLDAAECPPTFGTPPDLVQAVIAGGPGAVLHAAEGAEDDAPAGAREMDARRIGPADAVVGVAASGETPFVLGAVRRARELGAATIAVACSPGSSLEAACELAIVPLPGPEVIAGSTRLKAGTAQKLVLNMLSTLTMVQLGKIYGNLMVDVQATNEKLRRRAARIVAAATGAAESAAVDALARAGGRVPVAIIMLARGVGPEAAADALRDAGSVRRALGEVGGR
ncbi:MAG TPA: N-acetylmuramic acid 6-phosphate etherase [bacterium]|nr:N-acetylmuramic acid 6-phosphate etherase [bacterium]